MTGRVAGCERLDGQRVIATCMADNVVRRMHDASVASFATCTLAVWQCFPTISVVNQPGMRWHPCLDLSASSVVR